MSLTRKACTIATITALLTLPTAACSSTRGGDQPAATGSAAQPADTLVGIAMPTKSLERWNKDGAHLEGLLKQNGYKTTLQYADNKPDQQITQIQNMTNQGAKILVVAAIDGKVLTPALAAAKAKGATVIAYDRLINGSGDVDYYATFDNYKVGQLQGQFIKDKVGSEKVNLEPFAGSPDDNNAKFFFSGAWDVLSPMVQSGQITVPSGKAPKTNDAWTSIGVLNWSSDTAQSEMQNRLNSFYTGGKKVDVVLSPNDSLALGITQALEGAGYKPGAEYPIVTGQDADKANVINMLADKQAMTVWKDTRKLGDQVAKMVDQVAKAQTVETNDSQTYDNGVKVVPTYLLDPVVVTKETVRPQLVDSGFYSPADLGL
ncbi:substrate-binding domain-containing protein [Mobilicoccus caccae]|uniref:Sugar ABC transporter substrate-binding protein n=1 Tax=Mobilicoccus caccae TaxID=1859295 RepID=A0ABQ6IW06_9MICO|nr:sugar-binding protein [Mobilicoccus caccae]GMA41601.1 sugar ABC transporter substrate-binding protein [Mobilicoccus caccae]